MPRAMVGPGRRSKRSFSSDSIWRAANLSCCATSATASPCDSRAARSSAPMPVSSVKLALLQRLVFGRAGKAAAQLVGVALLGHALSQPALDAQREPQRLRRRRRQLVVARYQPARLVDLALPVADLPELQQRDRLVGLQAQRALEELLGVLQVLGAQRADPRGRVRAPGRRVQRVADRRHEVLDRLGLALRLAKEPAVVVVDVAVVRRE